MRSRDNGALFEAFLAAADDEQLRRFLETSVHSVVQLELLLVLREHRQRPVSPAFFSEALEITIDAAFNELEVLCEREVALFCPGEDSRAYIYLSQGAAIESALERLTYEADRTGLSTITLRSGATEGRGASIVYSFDRSAARDLGQ
jgi:hypothetical protein